MAPFIDTRNFNFAYGQTSQGEHIIDSQYTSSTLFVVNPAETGTMAIRIFGHHDRITFTSLFLLVILSIQIAISKDILPRKTEFPPINVAVMGMRFSSIHWPAS